MAITRFVREDIVKAVAEAKGERYETPPLPLPEDRRSEAELDKKEHTKQAGVDERSPAARHERSQ